MPLPFSRITWPSVTPAGMVTSSVPPSGSVMRVLVAVHRLEKIDLEPVLRVLPAHGEASAAGAAAHRLPARRTNRRTDR